MNKVTQEREGLFALNRYMECVSVSLGTDFWGMNFESEEVADAVEIGIKALRLAKISDEGLRDVIHAIYYNVPSGDSYAKSTQVA